ncbi:membrane-embedded CAAX protease MroQ-like isoform X1 [Oryza brachyantha]|uniref:CAAX prenyl protease 2/Lysostaphin resistance protein A-like domain-containing protein n=1 Tax=Oryza brachyantha TaxID=4533 RepID=J3MTA9_ORYBR|nr:membrane-embedded CAAX protease MroQ-like isoform X1 [Oryza brachyantha]
MASPSAPPSLLFRLRPMPCGGGGSLRVLSKRRLRQFLSPRTGRRRVVEELLMRLPEAGRRRGCGGFACFCSLDDRNDPPALPPDNKKILDEWPVLRRWDVPWEWPTISLTMVACAVSFLLTGMVEQAVLEYTGFQAGDATIDEKAEVLFFGQFIVTAVVLGVIFGITNTFRPFSDDVFRYDLKEPFKLENGWLLWAGVGLFGAIISISLAGAAMSFLGGETPERGTDSLVLLLPLIGSSNMSTACLLGITGVLAPILEETVFRGFLMVSLTMWFSTPISVLITASVFAFAHLTPGEFPQLFVLGVVLGFSYAQSRNLLTPIVIHAMWNSGVILLLTFLQLQGYNIKELLSAS